MRRMMSQRRDVLAIVVGLLLSVSVALGIVVLVALPNLRQGSPILTPDGERAIKRAKRQAKRKPAAAAGSTWHGLVALKRAFARLGRRIARIWAPISAALHEAMDRLEDRDRAKSNGSGADGSQPHAEHTARAQIPIRHAADHSRQSQAPAQAAAQSQRAPDQAATGEPVRRQERFDVEKIVGSSSVGRPRAKPPISGPIPEIQGQAAGGRAAGAPANGNGSEAEPGPDRDGQTIDLRAVERSDADQGAGSARRTR
jgi:hypothetical protein